MFEATRREFLVGAAAAAAGLAIPGTANAQPGRFRFAFLTDLHIQPELGAADGVSLAVKKLLSLDPRPDLVITGGDHVMDALDATAGRAKLQFDLLAETLKPLEMPIHSAVGNHDVLGWNGKKESLARDPGYGKQMFQERVAKGPAHRAVSHKGWRFILLDSIVRDQSKGWRGEIVDDQMQWLKDELHLAGKSPVVLVCHVPIMTLFMQYYAGTTMPSPDSLIVRNGKGVVDMIRGCNVKAILQGHTHVVEDCAYLGTRYITGGAVCGDWWKGPRLGVHPEGFCVFDVEGESFTWQYVPYGWKARHA